ncbi:MAG: hypothetical protein DRN07_01490 [Thermoplasmata archaeon]|nr:MAG: hypothetical protein DRN07_01490 [Thermoplasmata archaeon]
MPGGIEEERAGNFKLFGILLPSLPSLVLKLGSTFLQFKREAKRGGRTFQKELIEQGIDRETAMELTELYLESSKIKYYMDFLR